MSDEVETVIPKGQALIGYCCYCGVEFETVINEEINGKVM